VAAPLDRWLLHPPQVNAVKTNSRIWRNCRKWGGRTDGSVRWLLLTRHEIDSCLILDNEAFSTSAEASGSWFSDYCVCLMGPIPDAIFANDPGFAETDRPAPAIADAAA
jgi:hypothetical protein